MPLTLQVIDDGRLAEFVDFPFRLFRGHPYWVGDLKKDTSRLLGPGHPFWDHAERRLFMAFRDGVPVGRIAAILNRAHNDFHDERCGFFGFFDCQDDLAASRLLFSGAASWLATKGMAFVRGPVNPSTNETCGMLCEGFDFPPAIMTPYNPPYYLRLVEDAGFAREKDLLAWKRPSAPDLPRRFEKIVDRVLRDGRVQLEFVDVKRIDEALADLKDIYNSAWGKNWGFVPMTGDEIDELARGLRSLLKPDYLFFATVEGRPAAFCLILPDFNVPLKAARGTLSNPLTLPGFLLGMLRIKAGRLVALGVKNEFRNKGLEMLLIKQAILSSRKVGWEYGELSWTLEDNEKINSIIEMVGGRVYRRHRIYRKLL